MKYCQKCKTLKFIDSFYVEKRKPDGRRGQCIDCVKKYNATRKDKKSESDRNYRLKNKDKIVARQHKHVIENREHYREYHKKWRSGNTKYKNTCKRWIDNNKKSIAEIHERYYKKNKFSHIFGCSIRKSLKNNKRGQHWEDVVGYTLEDLKKHLESKFESWMTWDNYGEWHIDHIIPVSSFNFSSIDDDDFKKCWSLDNLQPLEKIENLRKGCRLDYKKVS